MTYRAKDLPRWVRMGRQRPIVTLDIPWADIVTEALRLMPVMHVNNALLDRLRAKHDAEPGPLRVRMPKWP